MKEVNQKQNIYSKINVVNILTNREITKLNSKYYNSGLFLKQVIVDKFGNEIIEEKSKRRLLGKKRERKAFNYMNHFLYGYYGKKEFDILNQNLKDMKKLFEFDTKDKKCTRKCLSNLKDSLNKIKIDCEYMANKNSTIETEEYQSVVLKYIAQFRQYITKDQYDFLYNKWKNELLKVKGTDLFNFDKINNIENWKVSILKCFKSEIVLYAICNIYDGIIKGSKFVIEYNNKNELKSNEDNGEKEEEKDYESEENNGSFSESDLTEKTFDENMINS